MIVAPDYIKAMVKPNGSKPKGRKVWSIDLETVWLPFLTATNLNGETAIAHAELGAPLRLGYDADGSVKLNKLNRPVIKVAKEVADFIKLSRENYVASLMDYTHSVVEDDPEGYRAQIEAQVKAGKPIVERDRVNLKSALEAVAEAERIAEAEVMRVAKAQVEKEAKAQAQAQTEKAKVTA